jgi:hypothetical protein
MPVFGLHVIQELGLGRGRLEALDRTLEDTIYKLESNQPLNPYLKEDCIRLLHDFQNLLVRLDDMEFEEILGSDDEDEEEEEEAKATPSPDGGQGVAGPE